MLTQIQRDTLLKPIKATRVKQTQGNSYLEAWDVIAYLTKVFGFEGWDKEIVHLDPLFESAGKSRDGQKDVWTVAYFCQLRLTIRDPQGAVIKVIDDVGTGDAINQPSRGDAHDLACKTAVSSALKRCAKDLGDQFGLGLYDGGSTQACLGRVIIYEGVPASGDDGSVAGPPEAVKTEPDQGAAVPVPPASERSGGTATDRPKPASNDEMLGSTQRARLFAMCRERGLDPHGACTEALEQPVLSVNDLSGADASKVIEWLKKMPVKA